MTRVATVPTVYGIETMEHYSLSSKPLLVLQQYLPFTVLKRCEKPNVCVELLSLVAIVFTACGIETLKLLRKLPIL